MPNSSDIDNALVAKLQADTALLALMPDGVYFNDKGPWPGAKRYVEVSLVTTDDVPMLQRRSHEEIRYQVKAVGLSKLNPDVNGAAARIDALLEGGSLTVSGYTCMVIKREQRIRYPEPDADDPTLRWWHRGAHYTVMMSVT